MGKMSYNPKSAIEKYEDNKKVAKYILDDCQKTVTDTSKKLKEEVGNALEAKSQEAKSMLKEKAEEYVETAIAYKDVLDEKAKENDIILGGFGFIGTAVALKGINILAISTIGVTAISAPISLAVAGVTGITVACYPRMAAWTKRCVLGRKYEELSTQVDFVTDVVSLANQKKEESRK